MLINREHRPFGIVLLALLSFVWTLELLAQPSLIELVRRSGLIFVGTVKVVGDATPTIVRSTNTAIVDVERVIDGESQFGNIAGKQVTVRLRDPRRMRAGQRAVFYTYVQTAGATLGLVEVGSEPAGPEAAEKSRVAEARQAIADQALTRRLATAQIVVVGIAGKGQPTPEARERKSEHDPMWWRVPIKIESILKGRAPNGSLSALYASSDDMVWERAPKPKAGEEGIFLLQPDSEKRFEITGLFLIDPLDVQPKTELDRVRRLLALTR